MGRDCELISPPLRSPVVKALTYLDYCDSRVVGLSPANWSVTACAFWTRLSAADRAAPRQPTLAPVADPNCRLDYVYVGMVTWGGSDPAIAGQERSIK